MDEQVLMIPHGFKVDLLFVVLLLEPVIFVARFGRRTVTEVVHCFAPRRNMAWLRLISGAYAVERVHPGLAHTLNSARSLICQQPPPRCSIASAPFLSLEPRRKPRERGYATRSVLQLASSWIECGKNGGGALIYIRLLDRFRSIDP